MQGKVGNIRLIAWLVCAAMCPDVAAAQDFQRVTPKLPAPATPPAIPTPQEAPAPAQDQTVLVPALKGIVFVNDDALIKSSGVESVPNDISAQDLPLLSDPDFVNKVRSYIGRRLTRGDLDAIANLVREIYRKNQRPFINVSVPPQRVQSGIIQVVVTEYRVGEISVTGNKYFSTSRILGMSDLQSGEPLTLPELRRQLDEFNSNPFLTVNAVMKPGRDTGQSDITLEASDRLPLRVYAGYDNQGVRTLGRDEWNVGVNWGNAFGLGQILSYQFTRSFTGRYTSHSASDIIPLDGENRIFLFGASATQLPFIATEFNSRGNSGQLSGRFVHDLPGWDWLKHSIEIGVDYKHANNNLEFSGFRILDTKVEILQFALIYSGTFTDRYGQTVVENDLVYAPGNLAKYNTDEAVQQLVPFGSANYVYDRFSVTRTTALPYDVTWIARASVQGASDNLPDSEQIGGGGIGSVRGYDTNTALGSQGVLLSQELRSPAFSPLRLADPDQALSDQMQFGVFWDYASLNQPTALLDFLRNTSLASVGFNAHYNLERYLDVQLEVGKQLRRAPGAIEHATQVAIVTTIAF